MFSQPSLPPDALQITFLQTMTLPCVRYVILTWDGALVLVQLASNVRTSTFSVLCFGCMGCLQLGFGCGGMGRWTISSVPSLAVYRAHGHNICALCRISAPLSLSGWLGCGWGVVGWLGGWCASPTSTLDDRKVLRFTEHMTTIYAPCVVFLHFLFLAGWAVAGWAGWLAGWCRRQQKTSF